MKTSKISMISSESLQFKSKMLITTLVVMLGTTTSFGKTNGQPCNDNNCNDDRIEMQTSNNHNGYINGSNRGGNMGQMDNRHFDYGRTCEMRPMRHRIEPRPVPQPEPRPMPEPEPRPVVHHCSNVGEVVGGVVVGTVIGTVLGSLIH